MRRVDNRSLLLPRDAQHAWLAAGASSSLFAPGVDVFEVLVSPSFAQAVYLDLAAARLSAAAKNGASGTH